MKKSLKNKEKTQKKLKKNVKNMIFLRKYQFFLIN